MTDSEKIVTPGEVTEETAEQRAVSEQLKGVAAAEVPGAEVSTQEKEVNPDEAERAKIYERFNARLEKLFQWRAEIFAKSGEKYKNDQVVLAGSPDFRACEKAWLSAMDKGQNTPKGEEAKYTDEERLALEYQGKYNQIYWEMEQAIKALDEKKKESSPVAPEAEAPKVEEPVVDTTAAIKSLEEI